MTDRLKRGGNYRLVSDVDRIADNFQQFNRAVNLTAPGYAKRTVNIKKLRRQARKSLAAVK